MHTEQLTSAQLTPEQSAVIEDVFTHRLNCCVTGPAGTGKSAVLKVLDDLAHTSGRKFSVVGTTGIAAVNVSGCTLHSWAGLPFDINRVEPFMLARNIERSEKYEKVYRNITETDILAIDEVSMLSGVLFDYFSELCSLVRSDPRPFGGMTLIVFGDFLQLPPVGDQVNRNPPFAFQAEAWAKGDFRLHLLTKIFRQADPEFGAVLSKIRRGIQDVEVKDYLNRLVAKPLPKSGNAVIIHTHNAEVDKINNKFLDQLVGESRLFTARDWCEDSELGRKGRGDLERHCLASSPLRLVVGARVMCLRNLDFDLEIINGSCGKIIGFEKHGSDDFPYIPVVEFDNGTHMEIKPQQWEIKNEDAIIARRRQIPLRVAYAITSHKAQGLTLDSTVLFLNRSFTWGQGYVALSRCKTFDGTYLQNFNARTFRANRDAVRFYLNPAAYGVIRKPQQFPSKADGHSYTE